MKCYTVLKKRFDYRNDCLIFDWEQSKYNLANQCEQTFSEKITKILDCCDLYNSFYIILNLKLFSYINFHKKLAYAFFLQ